MRNQRLLRCAAGSFFVAAIIFCLWRRGYYRSGLPNPELLYVGFYLSFGMGLVFLFTKWSQHLGARTRTRRWGGRLLILHSLMLLLTSALVGEAVLIVVGVDAANTAASRNDSGE